MAKRFKLPLRSRMVGLVGPVTVLLCGRATECAGPRQVRRSGMLRAGSSLEPARCMPVMVKH
jgi:hypothetical protein